MYSKKILFILPLSLISTLMFSCTKEQERRAYDKYGGPDAYIKTNGKTSHLNEPKNITFYTDISTGDKYRKIVDYAIKEVNRFSRIEYKLSYKSDLENCNFIITKEYIAGAFARFGITNMRMNSNAEILSSKIYFNVNQYDIRTEAQNKKTMIHEIGHSLGLNDIYADELKGYSVMVKGNYDLENYTKFDITNIIWYYGGVYK